MQIHCIGIRQIIIGIKGRSTDKTWIIANDIILIRCKIALNVIKNFVGVVQTNYGIRNVNGSRITINPATSGGRGCIAYNCAVGDISCSVGGITINAAAGGSGIARNRAVGYCGGTTILVNSTTSVRSSIS